MPLNREFKIKPAPTDAECVQPKVADGRYKNPWVGVVDHPDWTEKPLGRGGKSVAYTDDELHWLQPVLEPIYEHETDVDGVLRVTWLGHSSVWLNMEGVSILFDPMLSDTIRQPTAESPDGDIPRLVEAPCMVEQIPRLDAVVISHNHSGHLDVETLRRIVQHFGADSVAFFCPHGVGELLRSAEIGASRVVEMGWWEETTIREKSADDSKLSLACLPAQHWSMRSEEDVNKSLWASWAVIGESYRMIHIGDTGYCDAFKTIGKRYGPFDTACIPIGGYIPRAELRHWHVSPEEAVKIHDDLNSQQSIGIHWGTWFYGLGKSEHYKEPKIRLQEHCFGLWYHEDAKKRGEISFLDLWIGQTWSASKSGAEGCLLSNPLHDVP